MAAIAETAASNCIPIARKKIMTENKDKLRYIDFGENEYRCPCCGKKLMKMKVDSEFIDGLIDLFRNHSEDIPLLLVGFFRAIHSPETGIPVDAPPIKGEQN